MKLSSLGEVHLDELLDKTIQAGCRELHLRVGQSPLTQGCQGDAEGGFLPYEAFSSLDLQQIVYAILTDEQIRHLEREGEISCTYSVARRAALDVHVVYSKAAVEADFLVAQD